MALLYSKEELGMKAPDFKLPSTDGRSLSLADVAGPNGTLIAFICNHCPYVKTSIDRLVADARLLQAEGIGFAAICANDANDYPEDSFDNMGRFAKAHDFPFPYLHDEDQSVAKAYGAVCTPDYFGLDRDGAVRYRGRLDEGTPSREPAADAPRELLLAMRQIAVSGTAPDRQTPSMGCSIKWID